jgi:hypothetical protein
VLATKNVEEPIEAPPEAMIAMEHNNSKASQDIQKVDVVKAV